MSSINSAEQPQRPNKELERTKGAMARVAAPFAAQFRRWTDVWDFSWPEEGA